MFKKGTFSNGSYVSNHTYSRLSMLAFPVSGGSTQLRKKMFARLVNMNAISFI